MKSTSFLILDENIWFSSLFYISQLFWVFRPLVGKIIRTSFDEVRGNFCNYFKND